MLRYAVSTPITIENWKGLPVFAGRLATVEDVNNGRAIFCTIKAGGKLCDIVLPFCALLRDQKTGRKLSVVAVQAESSPKEIILGVVKMDGSTYVCTLSEVEVVKEPNEAFFKNGPSGVWQNLKRKVSGAS